MKKNVSTGAKRPIVGLVLGATATAAIIVACGGGGASSTAVVPTLRAASVGTFVIDNAAAFKLPSETANQYDAHLALATANAGSSSGYYDAKELRRQWCYSVENPSAPPELADTALVAPTKLFDNLHVMGYNWVSQFVLKTEDSSLFLLDLLNNKADGQLITEPGLATLGYDPKKIIAAMPTHGHGDHIGGAGYLQGKYGFPVYLGSLDAGVGAGATGARPFDPFTVTSLDNAILTAQEKTFGGSAVTLLSTPGHTPGTFSGIIPAKIGNTTYKLAFWGGTGTTGLNLASMKNYLDGTERLYKLSAEKKVDGTLHTHLFVDGSLAKIKAVAATPGLTNSAATNPFLIGNALALRSYAVLRECSAAKVAQLDPTAKLSAWHVTATQVKTTPPVFNGLFTTMDATAVVTNPFGWISGGTVTFKAVETGEFCQADTDKTGTAKCTINNLTSANVKTITAEFSGFTMPDGTVQLASAGSVALGR